MTDKPNRRTALLRALALLLVASTVASCKLLDKLTPAEGNWCTGTGAVCRGSSAALLCHDKKYVETACRGPKGCREESGQVTCDASLNTAADKCPEEWDDKGSCGPGPTFVTCHKGAYEVLHCRGSKGCYAKAGTDLFVCDMSVAAIGDVCDHEGEAGCTADKTTFLTCKDGKMGDPDPCRGPLGCHLLEGTSKIACDQDRSLEGDPCTGDGGTCIVDGSAILKCQNGKFGISHTCRGTKKCDTKDGRVSCDDAGLGIVGDACHDDNAACTADGKAFLKCKDGKLAFVRKCACVISGDQVSCH